MKPSLKPGIRYEHHYVVSKNKTVPALYPEAEEFLAMPEVFATGFLVGLLEWACIKAINPHLDWPSELTVGTRIDVSHSAATPPSTPRPARSLPRSRSGAARTGGRRHRKKQKARKRKQNPRPAVCLSPHQSYQSSPGQPMPLDRKDETGRRTLPRRSRLRLPGIGMESEFNVWMDGEEIDPKPFWKTPGAFIDRPLLPREKSSLQLPTGGAVYFDRGVIEVVTPVIELAPHSTARMVRNLWEQIGFVRDQLTLWEKRTGHTVRLKAYSSHYNISYEIPRRHQSARRNIRTLALFLAYILPVPVMLVASNRRSTGVGVRPRGDRIEITVDFTP